MRESSDIAQLLCINTRFAHLTRSDPYLARQIKDAVDQSLSDSSSPTDRQTFQKALDRLAQSFGLSPEAASFAWIDTETDLECRDPLWLRETIMTHLKKMTGQSQGTILIANLSTAFRSPKNRWSPSRRKAYADMVEWLREFIKARTRPEHPINLLLV